MYNFYPRQWFPLTLYMAMVFGVPVANVTLALHPDPYTWTSDDVDYTISHYSQPNAPKVAVRKVLMKSVVDLLFEVCIACLFPLQNIPTHLKPSMDILKCKQSGHDNHYTFDEISYDSLSTEGPPGVFELQAGEGESGWNYIEVGYWTQALYMVLNGFRDVPSLDIEIKCDNDQDVKVVCATGTFRWVNRVEAEEVE